MKQRQFFVAITLILGHIASADCAIASSESEVVARTAVELQNAFRKRGTVVLLPGKTYTITPPLLVNGLLDCRGATITAASAGKRAANDPLSTLIECDDSTIINGTLDCEGLVNTGVLSRGRFRALDLTINNYRRKGIRCVHGRDNRPVDSIIIDRLKVSSQKLDPRRTGPAIQYDSSKPCQLMFLNNITVGRQNDIGRTTSVFKVAHVMRLYAENIDAGGSKIVFGENVGEATIRVKHLHYEKAGRGIDYHPDPTWKGPKRPRMLTVIEEE